MGRIQLALVAALALVVKNASAFTIGTPTGLGSGTTGGGNGTVVYPTSTGELIAYLNETEPLVIVLNQTFNFQGTEGTTTETGCRPDYTRECMAKNNGFKSQDVIIAKGAAMNATGGCSNGTEVTLTYDNAALKRLNVKGNKTIRGVGKSGVIMGKGMSLNGDNIIVQNVHITELNSHVVWGGDAIFMQGTNKGTTALNNIWLDHIKVSHVGRQMVVTNKAGVASMTISNSDFDGNTDYSATCDGHHYWTFLLYGKDTRVSMLNNYVHGTSGRSPKIGGNADAHVVAHVANNYWGDNSGHSFEIDVNAFVLAEGNYFNNTMVPMYKAKAGSLYGSNGTDADDTCVSYLGRQCQENVLVSSGNFTSLNGPTALETIKTYPIISAYSPTGESDSAQQQQTQQYTPGTAKPSGETTPALIPASDLAQEWAETTNNWGVGMLD